MSPKIDNKFIHRLADNVKAKIIHRIKKPHRYTLLVDSPPENAYHYQHSLVMRQ